MSSCVFSLSPAEEYSIQSGFIYVHNLIPTQIHSDTESGPASVHVYKCKRPAIHMIQCCAPVQPKGDRVHTSRSSGHSQLNSLPQLFCSKKFNRMCVAIFRVTNWSRLIEFSYKVHPHLVSAFERISFIWTWARAYEHLSIGLIGDHAILVNPQKVHLFYWQSKEGGRQAAVKQSHKNIIIHKIDRRTRHWLWY